MGLHIGSLDWSWPGAQGYQLTWLQGAVSPSPPQVTHSCLSGTKECALAPWRSWVLQLSHFQSHIITPRKPCTLILILGNSWVNMRLPQPCRQHGTEVQTQGEKITLSENCRLSSCPEITGSAQLCRNLTKLRYFLALYNKGTAESADLIVKWRSAVLWSPYCTLLSAMITAWRVIEHVNEEMLLLHIILHMEVRVDF